MIKQKRGKVIYQPLNTVFQVLEKGGSSMQKYNGDTSSWNPNRALAPFSLEPQLLVQDPEGILPAGDYTTQLREVTWILESYNNGVTTRLVQGVDYTIDASTKMLSIEYNVALTEMVTVKLTAHFIDPRTGDVLRFDKYEKLLLTEPESNRNVTLFTGLWKSKTTLSPFKKWGQFAIPVQLKDGDEDIADNLCTYIWEWYTGSAWSNSFDDCLWYVSGSSSKQIVVDQDYIQDILLRVRATAYGDDERTFVTRLRRWYGQYQEDVEIPTGKYVFADTNMVVMEAKVTDRYHGDIKNLTSYFDISLYFAVGDNPLELVSHAPECIMHRSDLQDGDPQYGILARELSCFMPICDEQDKCLADDDGILLVAQFPTTTLPA